MAWAPLGRMTLAASLPVLNHRSLQLLCVEERRDFLEEGNSVRASIGNERKKLLAREIQIPCRSVCQSLAQRTDGALSPGPHSVRNVCENLTPRTATAECSRSQRSQCRGPRASLCLRCEVRCDRAGRRFWPRDALYA